MRSRHNVKLAQYDWLTFVLYVALVTAGLLTLYSIDVTKDPPTRYHQKQLIWFVLSLAAFWVVHYADLKKLKEWSSLIYLGGLILLAGLFLFGTEVSGARSWYRIGGLGFQPSELMKLAAALGLAKLVSERSFDLRQKSDIFKALLLLGIPAMLILMQPDLGSVLVFGAFLLVLYREGVSGIYFFPFFWAGLLFLVTVKWGSKLVLLWLGATWMLSTVLIMWKIKRGRAYFSGILTAFMFLSMAYVYAADYGFRHLLKPHQQKRIALILGLIKDEKGVGYHLQQSLIAVSNGGTRGQGPLEGVQLRGNYIPEQHTDYIFTAIAEQTGFTGSVIFLLLYLFFIYRLFRLAERQKQTFSRVVGYSLASLLLVHLLINVMMVIGLFPVVGIPIIYISYGGSALFIFSIWLFLFLKMDARRQDEL